MKRFNLVVCSLIMLTSCEQAPKSQYARGRLHVTREEMHCYRARDQVVNNIKEGTHSVEKLCLDWY